MNVLERIKNGETEVMLLNVTEFNGIPGKVQAEEEDKKELIRLAEIGQRMQWISVRDQLPELGEEVIVFTNTGRVTALSRFIRYEGASTYYWDNNYPGSGNMYLSESITHWMKLPDKPNKED